MTLIDTEIPEKVVTPEALRESLTIGVQVWQEYDAQTAELQAKYDAAKAAFEAEHADLIKKLETSKAAASNAKQVLQQKTVELYKLTGEKTWTAFQCAESWSLEFDDQIMLDWALNEAPGNLRRELLTLNTRALDKIMRPRIEETGVLKPWEGCKVPPAMARRSYTGKVLTEKIGALLASKPEPVEQGSVEKTSAKTEEPIPF